MFYIKSKLYDYMKNNHVSDNQALFELHKNMDYDDNNPDTPEKKLPCQVYDDVQLDGLLPGQIGI